MAGQSDTRRALFELAFWFVSLTLVRIVLALLAVAFIPRFQHEPVGYVIAAAVKGSLGMAIIITLLNRLLPRLLNHIK